MHILITRPRSQALDLKYRLEAIGHLVSLAPLLVIEHEPIEATAFEGASALIATSRNGLAALEHSPALQAARALPIFTVGHATSTFARDLGFGRVFTGPGTAAELATLIAGSVKPHTGPLVHLAGDHLAYDLAAALAPMGIVVQPIAAYRSVAATRLSDDIANQLKGRAIDAVILMSPRTAETWVEVASLLNEPTTTAPIGAALPVHICLSAAVADAAAQAWSVKGRQLPDIATAARPTLDDLLTVIERLAAGGQTR